MTTEHPKHRGAVAVGLVAVGWVVLAVVFLDEVLAVVAAGVWGHHVGGAAPAVVAPMVVMGVWWGFASPKARWGGPLVRPVTKVLVFGLASAGLWATGRPGWAVALLAFSAVVNGLAQLGWVRALVADPAPTRGSVGGQG